MSLLTLDGGNAVQASLTKASGFGVLYPGERVDVLISWSSSYSGDMSKSSLKITLDRE